MKKLSLAVLLFISMLHFAFSQTNTFPTTGNVGIGTTNPVKLLSLFNGIDPSIRQSTTNYIYLTGPSADDGIYHIARADGITADRLTILANGYVGIGTTTPGAKLDIASILTGAHSVNTSLLRGGDLYNAGANGQYFQFIGAGDGTNYTNINLISNWGYLSLGARSDGATTPANFLNILSNGNVGIGTTSPVSLLNLSGSGSNANGIFYVQSNNTGAAGTLIRNGFYSYTSQDNNGSLFQSWGMRFNGSDNQWYRTYTSATNYLPYMQLATTGNIVFGGAISSATTDANPTLNPAMTINVGTGNVGIGATNTQGYKLAVNGTMIATAVTVKLYANWPDYVFKKDYRLPALSDVKTYIDQNHHLPDMPSETEVAKNGINLGEMNKLLTKKVEELTLYMIVKDKKEKEQEDRINKLEQQLQQLIAASHK